MYEAIFISIGSIKSRRVGKLDMVVQDTDFYCTMHLVSNECPISVTHVVAFWHLKFRIIGFLNFSELKSKVFRFDGAVWGNRLVKSVDHNLPKP